MIELQFASVEFNHYNTFEWSHVKIYTYVYQALIDEIYIEYKPDNGVDNWIPVVPQKNNNHWVIHLKFNSKSDMAPQDILVRAYFSKNKTKFYDNKDGYLVPKLSGNYFLNLNCDLFTHMNITQSDNHYTGYCTVVNKTNKHDRSVTFICHDNETVCDVRKNDDDQIIDYRSFKVSWDDRNSIEYTLVLNENNVIVEKWFRHII